MARDRKQLVVLVLAVLLMTLPFIGVLSPAPAYASLSVAESSVTLLADDSADAMATCGGAAENVDPDAWQAGRDRHRPVVEPDMRASAGGLQGNGYAALSSGSRPASNVPSRAAAGAQPSAVLQVFRC